MSAGITVDSAAEAASVALMLLGLALLIAGLIVVAAHLADRPLDAACRWTEALYQKKAKR